MFFPGICCFYLEFKPERKPLKSPQRVLWGHHCSEDKPEGKTVSWWINTVYIPSEEETDIFLHTEQEIWHANFWIASTEAEMCLQIGTYPQSRLDVENPNNTAKSLIIKPNIQKKILDDYIEGKTNKRWDFFIVERGLIILFILFLSLSVILVVLSPITLFKSACNASSVAPPLILWLPDITLRHAFPYSLLIWRYKWG